MNIIDFTKNGGYRFKQFTLRKMQEATIMILKAFVAFCNVPEIGNFIISGCRVVGPNITDGYLYIDGELCFFTQSPGTLSTKIKKNVVTQTLGFKNGVNESVFRYTNAVTDATLGAMLSDFVRVSPVFDANYIHTDNNFSDLDLAHLDSIEPGAEVNVQADWNTVSPLSDSYIKNKPIILPVLKFDKFTLGDFPNTSYSTGTRTITFPDIGTSNYMVLATMHSLNPSGLAGNDTLAFATRGYTSTSFDVVAREFESGAKNLQFNYLIIALP